MRKKKHKINMKDLNAAILDDDPEMLLATAILKQAVDDYISAAKTDNQIEIERLEKFFLSDWGQTLSFDHGEYIVRHCREICADEKSDTLTQT